MIENAKTVLSFVFIVAMIFFLAPAGSSAQAPGPDVYYVGNTRPPDDYLALRTEPTGRYGVRIEKMPNGTRLVVLRRQLDGWWYVKNLASGNAGWAFRGPNERPWILCCVNPEPAISPVAKAPDAPPTQDGPTKQPANAATARVDAARIAAEQAESDAQRRIAAANQAAAEAEQKAREAQKQRMEGASAAPAAALSNPQPTLPDVTTQRRVALIIANGAYRMQAQLVNPVNDAELLSASLRLAGFQSVIVKTDLTREQMTNAIREFANTADNADWAAIYYSGHGIELNGANYMIPIDARLKADRDIALEAVDVSVVLSAIEGARRLRLLVLDSCRSNPFVSQMKRTVAARSIGRGLAAIEPEAGTLVVYAAKHGQEALDGEGRNSPFAEALSKRIQTPNLDIRRLFDLVRDDVMDATNKKQQPFSYGSLSGSEDFFFIKR